MSTDVFLGVAALVQLVGLGIVYSRRRKVWEAALSRVDNDRSPDGTGSVESNAGKVIDLRGRESADMPIDLRADDDPSVRRS